MGKGVDEPDAVWVGNGLACSNDGDGIDGIIVDCTEREGGRERDEEENGRKRKRKCSSRDEGKW